MLKNYLVSAPLRSAQDKRPLDVLNSCASLLQRPLCRLAARKHLALQAVFSQHVLRKVSYIFLAE